MTTNKQTLREAADAANKSSWGRWESYHPHKGARGYEVKVGVKAIAQHCLKVDSAFIAAANPATVLALLDELEAAQHEKDELRQGFIANQEEAHEAIKYATELKEQLARACAGRYEAFREVDEMQKSLDHTHRRRAIWRGRAEEADAKLEAAEKRIAELEGRTPYGYLRQCDGQIQISIGSEQPHNRSGGYATPWFAIYTAAAGKGEAS